MKVIVALGGNALLRRGEPMTSANQRENVKRAAVSIAELVTSGHQVTVTHGNGPQIGLLALQSAAYDAESAFPLDLLGAETEGMIGYLIEQELENALGACHKVATLLTQIEVEARDPAFSNPTKPVGPVYEETEARKLAQERGWTVKPDGAKYRRVVPSPKPKHIPDTAIIKLLLDHDVTVICAGGGGIPVVRRADGSLVGVEAVIDKDAASCMLATDIEADALLMLTDVDRVYLNWNTPEQQGLDRVSADDLLQHEFEPGSMQPKVHAACRFVMQSGGMAGIGRLEDAAAILDARAGTVVSRS